MAAQRRQNITLDPKVFEEFCNIAGAKGIKISTWINIKMKEFIEEEKAIQEAKSNNKR